MELTTAETNTFQRPPCDCTISYCLRRCRTAWTSLDNKLMTAISNILFKWRLFIIISRESKWGTLKSAGNPRCAGPAESHSICTDRRQPVLTAGLQVCPTSDTCQSVAILMNRCHCLKFSTTLKAWQTVSHIKRLHAQKGGEQVLLGLPRLRTEGAITGIAKRHKRWEDDPSILWRTKWRCSFGWSVRRMETDTNRMHLCMMESTSSEGMISNRHTFSTESSRVLKTWEGVGGGG